jgi:aminopeptidase
MLKIKGADRIGEAAIGTNYGITQFTKNMLFDEKMGGTIHTSPLERLSRSQEA